MLPEGAPFYCPSISPASPYWIYPPVTHAMLPLPPVSPDTPAAPPDSPAVLISALSPSYTMTAVEDDPVAFTCQICPDLLAHLAHQPVVQSLRRTQTDLLPGTRLNDSWCLIYLQQK